MSDFQIVISCFQTLMVSFNFSLLQSKWSNWFNQIVECENKQNHNELFVIEVFGSKHVIMSQKGHQMLDLINQNQTFNFLLPLKTIVIMEN